MKIAVFGASGTIGLRITLEALARDHTVTAIVRRLAQLDPGHEYLTATAGDVLDPDAATRLVAGHDVVVGAVGPAGDKQPQVVVDA